MSTWDIFLYTLVKILLVLVIVVAMFAPVITWAERRQSAMIQDRVGPNRASITIFGREFRLGGLLHPLADAMKMIWKEDIVPPNADKFLHALAPIIALIPPVAIFAVIPFGDTLHLDHLELPPMPREGITAAGIPMQIASIDVGILFAFAIAGTGVIGAAIAGYASDNKYSLLGGLRAASQMVSYEVALGLTLVPCFMWYGTLRLEEMATWQHDHGLWGIAYPPLTVAALLYYVAATAETKRVPFDAPEGESEIVGGYFTEYSGMKFGMFYTGEFIEVIALSALFSVIFLGGWDVPFLFRDGWDLPGSFRLEVPGTPLAFTDYVPLRHPTVIIIEVLVFFFVKMVFAGWFQLMVRWSLPKFRYDQIMALCWKGLLPLALVNIFFTATWILVADSM